MEQQENAIFGERQELESIHERALDYFDRCSAALLPILEEHRRFQPISIESDFYWSRIAQEDRELASHLDERLVQTMAGIILARKVSPLVGEADERDLVTATKTMRAALRLRSYQCWDTDVIHDEGTVLGVRPPAQSEDEAVGPDAASRIFDASHRKVLYVLDLVVPARSGLISRIAYSSQTHVTKYRQDTAFIMVWMDPDHPELDDVRDVVREVFKSSGSTRCGPMTLSTRIPYKANLGRNRDIRVPAC